MQRSAACFAFRGRGEDHGGRQSIILRAQGDITIDGSRAPCTGTKCIQHDPRAGSLCSFLGKRLIGKTSPFYPAPLFASQLAPVLSKALLE